MKKLRTRCATSGVIAIIPARGASKRIKGKNIKSFFGRPIISYPIESALKSKLFDEVIVSTEDQRVARVARKYGAAIYELRSKKNAGDNSTLADALAEEIEKLEKRSCQSEYICVILATAATLLPHELKSALKLIKTTGADSLVCVGEFEQSLGRALKRDGKYVSMVEPKNKFKRTQDMAKRYFDAGRFYFVKTEKFKMNGSFFPKKTVGFIVPKLRLQDVDDMDDWTMLELKYKLLQNETKTRNHRRG